MNPEILSAIELMSALGAAGYALMRTSGTKSPESEENVDLVLPQVEHLVIPRRDEGVVTPTINHFETDHIESNNPVGLL